MRMRKARLVAMVLPYALAIAACSSATTGPGDVCQTICQRESACTPPPVTPAECAKLCTARQKLADDAKCDSPYAQFLGCIVALQDICSAESMCMLQSGMVTACSGPCESQSNAVSSCVAPFCSQGANDAECAAAQ